MTFVPSLYLVNCHFLIYKVISVLTETLNFMGKSSGFLLLQFFTKYRKIRHQPHLPDAAVKTTVYSRVALRARKLVQANLDFWTKFGQNSVSAFGIDVHGSRNAFKSASLLAFESVWTCFAHLGGPLVQGQEKMKTRYTKMLHSATQGGFMYSAQKLVEANSGQRSLMEYDLSSAYGFLASHALMPSDSGVSLLERQQ